MNADFMATDSDRYVYRHDSVDGLRLQRDDPYLRARRVDAATGSFDHHQVMTALESKPDGHAVFRMSFWRTLQDALADRLVLCCDLYPRVLQRVRKDEPVLREFQWGDDEFLPGKAWLLWQTGPIAPEKDQWSALGIPHERIEALRPDGVWEPLFSATAVRGETYAGWDRHYLHGQGGGPCPVYVKSQLRNVDGQQQVWVLVRQPAGPWTSILHYEDGVQRLVQREASRFQELVPSQVRWVVALEASDRVMAREFVFSWSREYPTGWRNRFVTWLTGHDDSELVAQIKETKPRYLCESAVRALYRDFGASDVLLFKARWAYTDATLASFGMEEERVYSRSSS